MSDDERIAESVHTHGWHPVFVEGAGYTVGLAHTFGHPEIVIYGLDPAITRMMLVELVTDIRGGKVYAAGNSYAGVLAQYDVAFRGVHRSQCIHRLGHATDFYELIDRPEHLRALQLFWPDANENFPFDAACDPAVAALQPRLDVAA